MAFLYKFLLFFVALGSCLAEYDCGITSHPPAINATVNSTEPVSCTTTGPDCSSDSLILSLSYQPANGGMNHSLNNRKQCISNSELNTAQCSVEFLLVLDLKYNGASLFCNLFSHTIIEFSASSDLEPISLISYIGTASTLSGSTNSTHIMLTWVAPETLQNIQITYSIDVIQEGMLMFSFNSTQTSITYELDSDKTDPCQSIQVNITTHCGNLESNTSSFDLPDTYFIKVPNILNLNYSTQRNQTNEDMIDLSLEVQEENSCPGKASRTIFTKIQSFREGVTESNNQTLFLPAHDAYNITVRLENDAGLSVPWNLYSISFYFVKNGSAEMRDEELCVKCNFEEQISEAGDKCKIDLVLGTDYKESETITQNGSNVAVQCFSSLPSGNHTAVVSISDVGVANVHDSHITLTKDIFVPGDDQPTVLETLKWLGISLGTLFFVLLVSAILLFSIYILISWYKNRNVETANIPHRPVSSTSQSRGTDSTTRKPLLNVSENVAGDDTDMVSYRVTDWEQEDKGTHGDMVPGVEVEKEYLKYYTALSKTPSVSITIESSEPVIDESRSLMRPNRQESMAVTTESRQESSANLQSLVENSNAECANVGSSVNEAESKKTEQGFQHLLTNPDEVELEDMPAVTTEAVAVSEHNPSETQEQVLPNDSSLTVPQSPSRKNGNPVAFHNPQHNIELGITQNSSSPNKVFNSNNIPVNNSPSNKSTDVSAKPVESTDL